MSVFESKPHSGRKLASLSEALDQLTAFNALYAVHQADANPDLCGNPDDTAMWRKLVHDGVINCGGEPMELDFFEKIFGGKTEAIDAKKLYFRYNADYDMNIFAQENAKAATVGGPCTFLLHKSLHSADGAYSYPVEGYSIYIYQDKQWARISAMDKGTAFAHTVTVKPYKKNYQINIRKDSKIMVMPVQLVGGLSSPADASSWQTLGYSIHVRPFRIRKDWETPIDLMRGYEEVLQWAVMFDENGKEVDTWETFNKTNARRDMKWAKNLLFFMGQEIDNPDLLGNTTGKVTIDYSGFDGYVPTMFHGGGQLIDVDPGVGFDFEANFEPVMIRNDSQKLTTEYLVMDALPFRMALNRNANKKFKESGNTNFETFKRGGANGLNQEEIKKMGVQSYTYDSFSLHFKRVSALSDTRGIGNHDFPHMGMFIPGNGLRDSKGKEVPAFQFFVPSGKNGATSMLEEVNVDERKTVRIDKLSGYLAETIMAVTHCPHQHMLAYPSRLV
jgi:hypothetical protein